MSENSSASKIAVIGMACRFPGADTVEQYWNNLINGKESISFLSTRELLKSGLEPGLLEDPAYVRAGSFLDGFEFFDHDFFNYTKREAGVIDPQHRLFLECCWHALEDACIKPGDSAHRIGVFGGCHMNSYLFHVLTNPGVAETVGDMSVELGNEKDYLATRVSYKLDLRGPSMNVQTACSSSLVAVHMAVQSLLNGECDAALAGGVTINDFERKGYVYQPGGIKSPDGHCRAFAEEAGGTVFGNGLGVVVLKRLEEARADGHTIYASVIGTAINNDGADKVGMAAPGFSGQRDVVEEAVLVAGITPVDLCYIECHGTATRLGDSIEVSALKDVFSRYPLDNAQCGLGSVKTNLGHLNKASGIAGFIKTVLGLKNRRLPATLHFTEPNPLLELENSPFYVVDRPLDLSKQDKILRAGVSSFGVGGTNAHVILEEAERQEQKEDSRDLYLLPYSGQSEAALARVEEGLNDFLRSPGDWRVQDLAYTLQRGRFFFPFRKFMLVDRAKQVKLTSEQVSEEIYAGAKHEIPCPGVGVFYAGQIEGASKHLVEMLRGEAGLQKLAEPLLRQVEKLAGAGPDRLEAAGLPPELPASLASFVLQFIVCKLLSDLSPEPRFYAGLNQGELAAACAAGVMSWEDGLKILFARGGVSDPASLGSLKLSPPAGQLFLGQAEEGNASPAYLNPDYWLEEDAEDREERDFWRDRFPAASAGEEFLLIRAGAPQEGPAGPDCSAFKVLNAICFSENRMTMLPLLGKLWANRLGSGFDASPGEQTGRFIPLPGYPFEKTKCWLELDENVFREKRENESVADFLYTPSWQQLPLKKSALPAGKSCWLFLNGEERWTETLRDEVCKAGYTAVVDKGNHSRVTNPEDYRLCVDYLRGLTDAGSRPECLVYSLIAETPPGRSALFENLKTELYNLLRLVCAIDEVFGKNIRILLLTNNVYSVLGEQAENYFASVFRGGCLVIPQEFPGISCLGIDVDSAEYDPASGVFREIIRRTRLARQGEWLVFRGNYFWKRAYGNIEDFDEVKKTPPAIDPAGVYVITGGSGGIGPELITYLIESQNPRIAVISRNPHTGRLTELAAKAAELKLFPADVTDKEALRRALREISRTMGRIRGVFHLAGKAGRGLILNKEEGELRKVLAPKLDGTLLLASVLEEYNPDFFMLFSSTIALKGGAGQVDYCGANNFLDNYAACNPQRKIHTVSVNWDAWSQTGMAADSPQPGGGLTPARALDCLDYILRDPGITRVVVSRGDANSLSKQAAQSASRGGKEAAQPLPGEISFEYVFERLSEIFSGVTGEEEIDPDEFWGDAGIDSVLLLQLFNGIDRVFPGAFSLSQFYIHSTLKDIATCIYSELTAPGEGRDDPSPSPDAESTLSDYMQKIKDEDISIEEAVKHLSGGEFDNE